MAKTETEALKQFSDSCKKICEASESEAFRKELQVWIVERKIKKEQDNKIKQLDAQTKALILENN